MSLPVGGAQYGPANGLRLVVNGTSFRAPKTFTSWQGYKLNVYAPPQRYGGERWLFDSWSDGRDARHTITTPADPARYTATLQPQR